MESRTGRTGEGNPLPETAVTAAAQQVEPAGYDPWEGYRPDRSDRLADPFSPPDNWHLLRKATRERIGHEAVALLAEQPGRPADLGQHLAFELLDRVRTVRAAEADIFRNSGMLVELFRSVLQKLLIAGDVAETIRCRTQRDHEQLRRIERIRGAAPTENDAA